MEKLLNYFVPEKYDLDLVINKNKKTIGGAVKVVGEVKAEVVKFHAVRLEVTDVLVNGEKTKFEADGEVLTIYNVKLGKAEIIIYYNGKLNENMEGAYLSTYEYEGHIETIVATQFESHYAREAFPCIDEPAAKAVFKLTITIPDKDDMVLANMPEVSGRAQGRSAEPTVLNEAFSETKTIAFEPTPRMSTYLLAWVVGKFHGKTVTNAHGVEIATYCALNQDVNAVDFANEIAAKSLEFYDDNFGVEYPLKKLDQVALPDFEAGAMENWGLVTYRESMMLAGEAATLGTKKGVALTVAHELSHQWFGDLVTMKWWDDLWLNESFASVMEYFAVDYIHPEYKIFEAFFTGDARAALMRDAYKDVQSVHQEVHDPAEIATLFDPAIVYSKGARLMLMTVRLMGWEKFCEGLKEYFEKYKYGNTVGDDLWRCLDDHADFKVSEMMHDYIDRPGYPVVTSKDGNFSRFTQKRFLLDGKMQESDWLLPEINQDMTGHYVLNLNDAQFEQALYDFDKLGLEEKLRLLMDRDLVARTELVSSASLVPLIAKFENESNAAVWSILMTMVGGLKIFFDYDSEDEAKFQEYVKKLAELKLAEIGLVTREGDDENILRMRANLLALDFYARDKENLKKLAEMYNSDYTKIDPEIRGDVLDAKIYLEPKMLDEYIEAYKTTADPELKFELLLATTLMEDKNGLKQLIKLLDQPEVVKIQDQFSLFIWLFRNPVVKKEVFAWMMKNWAKLREVSGEKSVENYPRYTASSIRTKEEYKTWREFFEPMSADAAMSRAIKIGKSEIEARLKLIATDGEAVRKAVRDII